MSASEVSSVRTQTQTLDLCLRIGEVLLASGAGAADVTATMQAVARSLGLRSVDVDITFTSMSMSYQPVADEPAIVQLRYVKHRTIDYDHLTRVDHLVRSVLRQDLDLREARSELGRITSSGHDRPRWAITIGWGLMCGGVGLQLGGDLAVVLIALIAAMTIDRLQLRMSRRRYPAFYQQIAGGGVATMIALAVAATPLALDPSVVVTANIVMLLAGIGFFGALQDALTGFYITAGARLTEAILATAGIIAGVSGGISLAYAFGVEVPQLDPGSGSLTGVGLTILGSAIAAGSFAYASYAPRRSLAPIALVAAVAMGITQSVSVPGIGRAWSVALAALFVGLVGYTVGGRLRVPPLVVVVSAVVPMLPGLSIYRGLTLLAEGGGSTSAGLLAMVTAGSVAMALSAGVILGEYVAQPVRREAARLESRLAGPRLVGPLRTRPDGSQRTRPRRSRRTRRTRRTRRSRRDRAPHAEHDA
ncbi:threonine/serine exporter family protein [Nocardioides sp. zg-579]|uniref:Threonine/serine exporter family protein n=1 Tax=Nocardioides marmotae TaxID=2663857 RepID=A0A6I3J1A3_9ACTN|nr:threonine/serine exporter family protein [Nocardioides marmotae]MCR6030411.1 threonine/serine exporter family protein [Gordonia jinghuaiqii]MTB94046.1 threonine/serine exporter family protein [Nocardioides marmotae]QKE00354.1 threonine/serine exporter family protein [Nocardioides marmotae]